MDVTMTTKELLGDRGSERTYSSSEGTTLGRNCRVRSADLWRSSRPVCSCGGSHLYIRVCVCIQADGAPFPPVSEERRRRSRTFPDGLKVNVASLWTESHVWPNMRRVRVFLYPVVFRRRSGLSLM